MDFPAVFSSLFPNVKVSVLDSSIGVRADFIPQPWQSQLGFFVGLQLTEAIAVFVQQRS